MSLFLRIFLLLLLMFALSLPPYASALASDHGGGEAKAEGEKGGEGEAKKGKEDEEVTGGKFEGDPVYVHLKPIVLPVISDRGAEQLVNIIIDLETKDFDSAVVLRSNKPRLNDAVIRALYGGLGDASMRNANALDIPKIKDSIRLTINKTFGEGTIKDVLVQAVEQRTF